MAEYISREEAIDKMRSLKSKFRAKNDWDSGYDTAIAESFEHIKRVPAADVQPVNQWISVKDRLPDESCECLGIVDGEVTEVSYSPKCKELICVWSMCNADGFKPLLDDAVTHWMPLPEPPKDGDT